MQTQTMPTFGVGEQPASPGQAQVAPPQVLPVGTATLNGTVSHYIKRYFLCKCFVISTKVVCGVMGARIVI